MKFAKDDVILFQGDSITDCGRKRENDGANGANELGNGYALYTSAALLVDNPGLNLQCYNRGVSGNRIVDLAARIREDFLNLKPAVVSILIGVNDTWHHFGRNAGVAVPKFERVYRQLLTELRQELPELKLVLCEPFVLRCGVVEEKWVAEIIERRAVVKKLAGEFGAVFVPFQEEFDNAVKSAPPQYWAWDGVHPSAAGHMLMTRAWLKAIE